jgi:hypothetical protein
MRGAPVFRRRDRQSPAPEPHPAVPASPAGDEPAVGVADMVAFAHSLGRCPDGGRAPFADCPLLLESAQQLLEEEKRGLTPQPVADAVRAQLARRS